MLNFDNKQEINGDPYMEFWKSYLEKRRVKIDHMMSEDQVDALGLRQRISEIVSEGINGAIKNPVGEKFVEDDYVPLSFDVVFKYPEDAHVFQLYVRELHRQLLALNVKGGDVKVEPLTLMFTDNRFSKVMLRLGRAQFFGETIDEHEIRHAARAAEFNTVDLSSIYLVCCTRVSKGKLHMNLSAQFDGNKNDQRAELSSVLAPRILSGDDIIQALRINKRHRFPTDFTDYVLYITMLQKLFGKSPETIRKRNEVLVRKILTTYKKFLRAESQKEHL